MRKDETTLQDELRPEYDLRTLQVRKVGPGRKHFGGSVVQAAPDRGLKVAGIDGVHLRAVSNSRPLYMLPDDPVTEEVLIPCFQTAAQVDCMVGFFSSEVLASLAPGLATFVNGSQESFRLIISPLLRAEDKAAIEKG